LIKFLDYIKDKEFSEKNNSADMDIHRLDTWLRHHRQLPDRLESGMVNLGAGIDFTKLFSGKKLFG
jgi:hypothetical protein